MTMFFQPASSSTARVKFESARPNGPGVLGGGIVAAAVGFGRSHVAPNLNVGDKVFAATIVPARLVIEWFIMHDWCVWAWIPTVAAVLLAACIWSTIFLARHVPELHRELRRRYHDCPTCHHRGRPTYACPRCGAVERDLRASAYGVLFARCRSCKTLLPTLDLFGRHDLKRSCGHCGAAFNHEDVGRLPVWHVAMVYSDCNLPPRTVLGVIAGKLVYVHESGAGHVAATRSAASLRYLNLLDQLIIYGDDASLQGSRPLLAGILGVLERGAGVDVRRRTDLPACVVERSANAVALLPSDHGAAVAAWAPAMRAMFSRVSTWKGKLTSRSLGTLI